MSLKRNIAVVGCGYWGKNLVRNFHELNVLRYICDPDQTLANKISRQYDIETITFSEALKDNEVEGIILAVPAALHAKMAVEAMNHGKHVFVEKPLALNEEEGRKMIDSARKNHVHLMVGHLLQYHPVFIELKNIVHNGGLGNVNYIYSNRLSFGKVRAEEDVLWSFAPHDISMILSLTKNKPLSVTTESKSILQEGISDLASIFIEFTNNLKAHISVSWLNPEKEQKLVVVGSKAIATFDDTKEWDKKLSILKYQLNTELNHNKSLQKDDVEYIKVKKDEPLKIECQQFCNLINNSVTNITDGNEGLRVLNILNNSSDSSKLNKKIFINNA